MPEIDWNITTHEDLEKIPLFGEDEVDSTNISALDTERLRLKRRILGLRRRGLLKGREITPLGWDFVRHCLSGYTTFGSKLSLCHSTGPVSYPGIPHDSKSADSLYWGELSSANERLREDVWECEGWLEDAPKIVRDAVDINRRFGRYFTRRRGDGEFREFQPSWNSRGGNGWGADDQHLVSDYDEDHFTARLEDWGDYDFASAVEAFAEHYYELWALYLWSQHYHLLTSPESLMLTWRDHLARAFYDERCDTLCDALCLCDLGPLKLGWLVDPYLLDASDELLESAEPILTALESTAAAIHAEIAAGMRAQGTIVVESQGSYFCAVNNGAELIQAPFQATVKALILDTYQGPEFVAPETAAFRTRVAAALVADSDREAILADPYLKTPPEKGRHAKSK